jgi:hypothetical protein
VPQRAQIFCTPDPPSKQWQMPVRLHMLVLTALAAGYGASTAAAGAAAAGTAAAPSGSGGAHFAHAKKSAGWCGEYGRVYGDDFNVLLVDDGRLGRAATRQRGARATCARQRVQRPGMTTWYGCSSPHLAQSKVYGTQSPVLSLAWPQRRAPTRGGALGRAARSRRRHTSEHAADRKNMQQQEHEHSI